jgi:hypothetical protein
MGIPRSGNGYGIDAEVDGYVPTVPTTNSTTTTTTTTTTNSKSTLQHIVNANARVNIAIPSPKVNVTSCFWSLRHPLDCVMIRLIKDQIFDDPLYTSHDDDDQNKDIGIDDQSVTVITDNLCLVCPSNYTRYLPTSLSLKMSDYSGHKRHEHCEVIPSVA